MRQEPARRHNRAMEHVRSEVEDAAEAALQLAEALTSVAETQGRRLQVRWAATRLLELDRSLASLRPYLFGQLPTPLPGEQ